MFKVDVTCLVHDMIAAWARGNTDSWGAQPEPGYFLCLILSEIMLGGLSSVMMPIS